MDERMRKITDHVVNPVNDKIEITVVDHKGPGGAHHVYWLRQPDGSVTTINFQKGGIAEVGVNGVTQEALLAVVIDRLRCFQAGPYPSPENAKALQHCEDALEALKSRTRARMARGVEGKTVA